MGMTMSLKKFEFSHKDTYLLLGPQEVGKTCFLAGMYYTFRSALNGFSLSCVDEEQRVSLDMLCKDLGKGKFPQGTGGSTNYHFKLRKAHKERFPFDWYDYRGSMLEEGAQSIDEYDELVNLVNNSTCVLVCVDGTWLSPDKEKSVKTIQDNSYIINNFLNKYIDDNGILPPICVVITKYDTCDWRYEAQYYEAIRESFPFFESTDTPVFICPICIGKKENENFVFNPTDQDIYKPLFFALWCGYGYRIAGLKQNFEKRNNYFNPILQGLKNEVKKLEDRVIVINRENRIREKKKDIHKYETALAKEESRIHTLEEEQRDLFDKIDSSEGIYFGDKTTTWEEVGERWKFFL